MPAKNETKLDYFMDVILRNYCRSSEENDILYEEMVDLKDCLFNLYQENADLRFQLQKAGIEVLPSDFVSSEEIENQECLALTKT
jgi:hypothetical protein